MPPLKRTERWKPRLEGTACPGEVQPSPTPPAVLLTGELREGGHTSGRDANSQMQEMPEVATNDVLQPASRAKTRGPNRDRRPFTFPARDNAKRQDTRVRKEQ
eukprot:s4570_g9.t1